MPSEHEVFTEALSFSEAAARTEYLDRVCGADNIKRQRLNELLKLHESMDSVLDRRPQEMIESLSDGAETVDSMPQSPDLTLAALLSFLEPASQADSLGRLSHYELLQVLGQGGYGIVFKAFDTKLSRLVAVKILSPHLATTSPPRRRFLREARAAAAVRHEHVVQIYAVEESPIPYLVMEFVSGETLQQRSDRLGPFEPAEVIRLGQQIARGLAAAHEQGLIHRDIKPGNILIADGIEPVAKLSDFGLARTVDDASRSQSGIVIGTPMYMSPEQVSGDEVDQRTDLFSFGSVLYLMASGRPPFRASSTLAVLKRVAEDKPRSVHDVIADVPKGLCAVISRLHSKSRDHRYSTAKDVDLALSTCLTIPPRTWQRRAAEFCSTSQGRIIGVAVALLIMSVIGLLIGESTRLTHFFARKADIEVANAATAANAAESPQSPASHATIKQNESAATAGDKPAEKSVQQPVELPVEEERLTYWDKAVAAMTPEDQVKATIAKLLLLNPNLEESSIHFDIEGGVVSQVRIQPADHVINITPLHALRRMAHVRILATNGKLDDINPLKGLKLESIEITGHPIHDLDPLRGMPLTSIGVWPWHGDDLSPLRGMKLRNVNVGGGNILRDLEPLRGMPLEMACFNFTKVEDISPLQGMPLRRLEIQNTNVTDLTPLASAPLDFLGTSGSPITDYSPLKGSKLNELSLDYVAARDEAVLRSMRGLQSVNGRPAAEFLMSP